MDSIVVVGAGLAGLAVSLGLSKAGYHVHLVEKRSDFDRRGATLGLAANGRKALEEICPEAVEYLSGVGIPVAQNRGHMLPWSEVRDCLLRRVRDDENITLLTGLSVSQIDDETDDSCARVYFENSDEVLEGRLAVGADGVHSTVRRILGLPAGKKTSVVWRGSVEADEESVKLHSLPDGYDGVSRMKLHGNTFLSTFNFVPKVSRIAWVVSSKEESIAPGTSAWDVLKNAIEDEEERDLIQTLFERSEENDVKQSYDLCVHKIHESDAESGWGGRGRITLIGDAAHALRPASGQGGSMAFEDCVVLCRMLKEEGGRSALCGERVLCSEFISCFENERLPRVKRLSADQEMRADIGYKGVPAKPWSNEFEEWVYNGV